MSTHKPILNPNDINNLSKLRIAIVQSMFNSDITDEITSGITKHFKKITNNNPEHTLDTYRVPGAVEIPIVADKIAAQSIANNQKYDAIIANGAIIRGDTFHFECVCQMLTAGITQVIHEYKIPIIFGVLTCDTQTQAQKRLDPTGPHGHCGYNAIEAAIMTIIELSK